MDTDHMLKRIWQITRAIWVLLLVSVILFILYYAIPIVYPFLIGWFVAYILQPVVTWLQTKLKFPRWLAVIAMLMMFVAVALLAVFVVVANVTVEIGSLVNSLQSTINQWNTDFQKWMNSDQMKQMYQQFYALYHNKNYQDTIHSQLSSMASTLSGLGSRIVQIVVALILNLLAALPNIATILIITLLSAFFMSKDWFVWIRRLSFSLPANVKTPMRSVWKDLQHALFGYIRAQLIILSMTTLLITIGLSLLHIQYALTIAFLIGLLDMMPYLGTGGVMIPWIIIEFVQKHLYLGIGLSILYGVVVLARQIVEPKVLASNVGLDPLSTLIAMFIGLKLFGVIGLAVGPALLVLLSAFHKANIFKDLLRYILEGRASKE